MNLVERINDDIKTCMKSQDKEKLSVIRMVKAAILTKNARGEVSDEEVIDIISKQIKMRKDSVLEFSKAGRDDLAMQYSKEIEVLNLYMPEQLTEDEVRKIIDEVFDSVKPTSQKQMGLIMKEVTPKVKGKFDMGIVSKIIKEKLEDI